MMICEKCGATVAEGSQFCGKCGQAISTVVCDSVQTRGKQNTLAVIGFVVSMISLLINFWGIVGIAAMILSVIGVLQIQQRNEKGKWMAVTGIVVGGISVFWGFISLLTLASF